MDTRTDEIAPKIYRFSTYVPAADLVFNQYLIDAAEPLLFHTGCGSCSRSFARRCQKLSVSSDFAGLRSDITKRMNAAR